MPERLITAKVLKFMDRINNDTDNPYGEYLQDILKEFAYEIMELCGKPVDDPPRSKFMEEYFDNVNKVSASHWNEWIIKLIDKHKADK